MLAIGSFAEAHEELFKLTPSDGAASDFFGYSVALDGGLGIVGAYFDDDLGPDSGSAYLFDVSTGQQVHKLTASDGAEYRHFGHAVSIRDGLALVGAPLASIGGSSPGSAYVFDVVTMQELHVLVPADAAAGDSFGNGVSLDGGLLFVGAPRDDDNGTDSGSAYLFDAITGQELRKLLPADGTTNDHFGCSVALDGGLALVGAYFDDDHGVRSGSAYVFDATTGQQLHKLVPADGAVEDWFGRSVALDNGQALVGSERDDDNGSNSGSAYLFDATTGQELLKLLAHDGNKGDGFGFSVSLDGGRALVGALFDDDNGRNSGSAYVFDLALGLEPHKLVPNGGAHDDEFGRGVFLEGGRALVGAPRDDDNGSSSGSAYVFDVMAPGRAYCFGEPGSGTPCPCGNDNDGSVPRSGCANGVFASGAKLAGGGLPSVSNDSLVLVTTHAEPNNTGLYFQGDNQLPWGFVWGDGLRCAGFGVRRLQVRFADATGTSSTTIALGVKGAVAAGDTKNYQLWYRTTVNPPCGPGVNDFNASNGYSVTWLP